MHNLFGHHQLDKLIAISILVLLLLMSYLLVTQIYLEGLNLIQTEIDINRKKSSKVDGILEKEKYYRNEINKIKGAYKQPKYFLSSNQSSTASSEVQNKLKKIINSQTKAKILTLKPYPVTKHEGYSEVSIEIRMKDVSHNEIQKMLYQIESEYPLIIINELDITRTQLTYKSILGKRNDSSDLNITLVASGFFRGSSDQ